MNPLNVQRIKEIKSFPSLVKYLRDELDWPIESDNFDDLTFDYEPEELGIDAKTAVKIKEIKQLRPLSSKQPWGIFFINFEPKQLPIVVLRRILRSLVIKKRASANKAQQAAWQLHDLLFISSYGEDAHRELTFAHFSEPTDRLFGDLPTLRVLGWDDDDTKLKIDHVVHILSEKLRWPADENNTEEWRNKWSDAFELRPRQVITTSKELAILLADLAKSIRQRANLILAVESERGPLTKLHKAFQTALIHDLNEDDFADMYAQTIAYGLLAARVSRPVGIVADNLADMVPITNPFLKEMLGTFLTVGGRKGKIDFDELGIQEVVDLLNSPDTNVEAVLRDFGKRTMQEDPVVHFYELFLKEYDKKKKVERGVFYTPQPVVSYIVRSVHELLKTEFGLEDGLASTVTWGEMAKRNSEIKIPEGVTSDEPFVLILDIATGTATFLVEVIEVIHNAMEEKWKKEGHMAMEMPKLWNEYVPKHLLPRLYGYELMMAPYAIAHMKIGLKLAETGYRFGSNERAHIYLTNSLEPPTDIAEQPHFEEMAPALAHEANAVNTVKRRKRFTIVMGNPPYSGHSANVSRSVDGKLNFIGSLINEYYQIDNKPLGEKNPKWLQDDYVKFLRVGQWYIAQSKVGILSMITNHGYIDNPTFRGMRQQLINAFSNIYLLDLHGSLMRRETAPDKSKDENVFDIQQGVSICLMSTHNSSKHKNICHSDLYGTRSAKYEALLQGHVLKTDWHEIHPLPPFYLLIPQNSRLREEQNNFWKITDIFPINNIAMQTHRDYFLTDIDEQALRQRIKAFYHGTLTTDGGDNMYELGSLDILKAQKQLRNDKNWEKGFVQCLWRPFDTRFLYYNKDLIDRPRPQITEPLLKENIALLAIRQVALQGGCTHFLVTKRPAIDRVLYSNKGAASVFPLYLYPSVTDGLNLGSRYPNLATTFVATIEKDLNVRFMPDDSRNNTFNPQSILNYSYAIFHSPSYRSRYAEFLKIDFPRLPLTSNLELFRSLARLGGELVALHLMESPILDKHITRFIGKVTSAVEKISYSDDTVWIDKAKSQGFQGVSENVWNFHIGGYQVCEKWLKDRGPKSGKLGRTLSVDDINHYHRIVVALNETIHIMAEIDKVIEAHGGWPGAFADGSKTE